jgi:hypothetical protein
VRSPRPGLDKRLSPAIDGVAVREGSGQIRRASSPPYAAPAAKTADRLDLWQRLQRNVYDPGSPVGQTRQKLMAVLLVALFGVFVAVAYHKLGASRDRAAPDGGADEVSTVDASRFDRIRWQRPKPYPEALRDPMVFGASGFAGGEGPGLPLKGIIYSPGQCSAIVGSKIVHPGDKIGSATVVSINKNSVEFEANGKTWTQKVR